MASEDSRQWIRSEDGPDTFCWIHTPILGTFDQHGTFCWIHTPILGTFDQYGFIKRSHTFRCEQCCESGPNYAFRIWIPTQRAGGISHPLPPPLLDSALPHRNNHNGMVDAVRKRVPSRVVPHYERKFEPMFLQNPGRDFSRSPPPAYHYRV